ncbi:MAG TPA: TonB family protein [Pyrinomonadaceae bacterium]|jgi:protein TonB|nr:TonB family protein [Pyrinomonadaceae bacterium]
MFSNLVESGSHAADLKRKGGFFVGTLAFYGLLLAATGVGSIYAYNARVEDDGLEVYALMKFAPSNAEQAKPERQSAPRRAAAAAKPGQAQYAKVTEVAVIAPHVPSRQIAREDTPVLGRGVPYVISSVNDVPSGGVGVPNHGQGYGPPGGNDHGPAGPKVTGGDEEPPPAREVKAAPTPVPVERKKTTTVSGGVMNGQAIVKPPPAYPIVAKTAHISGTVTVQILVDESGRVVSAKATNGNALLHAAAVQAAYQARFTPTTLSGQPVKVSGVITYNFVLH